MNLSESFQTLGFVGAGNMASALLRAVAGKERLPPSACMALDAIHGKAEELARELGIRVAANLPELLRSCESIVLATKPQDIPKVLEEAGPHARPEHRFISIAAGVPTKGIEALLPPGARVVRVMPNTPAMIGEGAAGIAGGAHATAEDVRAVLSLFEAVGIAIEVQESDLDAITALSGSGPAYVFRFMEIMQAAGEEMGLTQEAARLLTLKTFLGASRLASESSDSPAELRHKVTSPGGTTAAALDVFEREGLERILKNGIKRAQERSSELAAGTRY